MATSSKIAYCLNMNTNHCHKKLKQFPGRVYKIKFTLRSRTVLFTLFFHLLNQAIFLAFSCINFSHYEFNIECLFEQNTFKPLTYHQSVVINCCLILTSLFPKYHSQNQLISILVKARDSYFYHFSSVLSFFVFLVCSYF